MDGDETLQELQHVASSGDKKEGEIIHNLEVRIRMCTVLLIPALCVCTLACVL